MVPEEEIRDLNETLYSTLMAMQVTIRALAKTHPDPQAFLTALRAEHEETMSLFDAGNVSDAVREKYRMWLRSLSPKAFSI